MRNAKGKHGRTCAARTHAQSLVSALAVYERSAARLVTLERALNAAVEHKVHGFDVKTFGTEIRKSATAELRRHRVVIGSETSTDVLGLYCVMAQQTSHLIRLVETALGEEQ